MNMMRKLFLTLIVLLSVLIVRSQDMSNSIEYSQLYIVGAATSAGWSDTNALEMSKINDGVFTWQGKLKGNEEFKFINTRGWYKNILSANPDVVVELSKNYDLDFYAAWDLNGKDWKFKMPETGDYCVTVDLNNMKMSVSKQSPQPQCPSKLYVTGSAVKDQIIELSDMHDVEFKGTITCVPGNIFLINTPVINANTTFYGPMYEDVDLTFGKGVASPLSVMEDGSKGWSVMAAGDYTLYVDKGRLTYQGRKFVPRKVLYIVGGCCELNWNYWDESNKRFIPNPDNPAELIWEGELRIGSQEEPDRFKILTAESWTEETFHPYISDALAEGITDARISGGDDLKWKIEKDGFYRLTFNTKTETLNSEYLGYQHDISHVDENNLASTGDITVEKFNIHVSNGIIIVDTPSASDVTVRNLTGQTTASKAAHTSGAVTRPLENGIYLVTIGSKTVKILVN